MKMFTINGIEYKTNDKGNYFYKSTGKVDKQGYPIFMRIPAHVFEKAFEEYVEGTPADWEEQADAEYESRKEVEERKDREAEANFNGKKTRKPRRSKDIAFSYCPNGTDVITLTAKQVDFIKHLPDTSFWEHGLESYLWCDVLADEIGGQFAGKPMTVGAMISTLREKSLVSVGKDVDRKGKPKFMTLTPMGKQIAIELGLE